MIGAGSRTGARLDIDSLRWRPFGRREPILPGLSLHIDPGEHVLLAGPSGSGKSTLLRAIAGVLASTEAGELGGSITVDGLGWGLGSGSGALAAGSGSTGAALLLQDPNDAMVAGLVGRDVAFGPENFGVERAELWRRVNETLDAVQFPYGAEHSVTATSGGQAQRLALAGVLVLGTRLILLDEPTSMLDPVSAAAVRAAVWAAGEASGATMLLVEHRFAEWLPTLNRLIVLDANGRLAADGPIRQTLRDEHRMLAAHGIWIPGQAAPAPVTLAAGVLRPAAGTAVPGTAVPGSVVLRATAVGVIRPPRATMLSSGTPATIPEPALENVSASVRAGEILAVVGASGAGKSTLTALLAGLTLPTSGTIRFCELGSGELGSGESGRGELGSRLSSLGALGAGGIQPGRLSSRTLAEHFGWVPQRAELAIVERTVESDVLSTALLLGQDPVAAASRTTDLLEALGLAALKNADPHTLSGGELRRLALAGAIAHGPAVLVLDEPTVGQDRSTWAAVVGLIVSARDAGVAVVVATHDPLLIALADRRLELAGGRVVDRTDAGTVASEVEAAGGAREPGSGEHQDPAREPDSAFPLAGFTPGQSVSRRPFAARCGPLSLLTVGFFLLVGSTSITTPAAAVSVMVELLMLPLVLGRRGFPLKRLIPGLLAVASIGFSTWLLGASHDPLVGVVAGLRVAFFVIPGVLLAGFIDPSVLGDHLGQRLRLPARPVIAAVAALQRFDSLGEQWRELRGIRRVRGLGASRSPAVRLRELAALTFALLVQTIRQAGRMAVAMDARGFSAARPLGVPRTWAEPAPWCTPDTALVAVGVALAALPWVITVLS